MIVEIVEALKTRCAVQFNGRIAGAAEFQLLDENAKLALPAAYVMPLDDTAEVNESENGYSQTIRDAFAVVIVLDSTESNLAKSAVAQVQPIRNALFKALLSWQPDNEHGPIEYEGGQLLGVDRARLYYQFEFSAQTHISEADTYQAEANAALSAFEQAAINVDLIDPSLTGEPNGVFEAAIVIDVPQT